MFLIAKDQIEEVKKVLESEVQMLVEFDGTYLFNYQTTMVGLLWRSGLSLIPGQIQIFTFFFVI